MRTESRRFTDESAGAKVTVCPSPANSARPVLSGSRPVAGGNAAYLRALRAAEMAAWKDPFRSTPETNRSLRQLSTDFHAEARPESWMTAVLMICVAASLLQFAFGMFAYFERWARFVSALLSGLS